MENRRSNNKKDDGESMNIKCNLSNILLDLVNSGYVRNIKVLNYNDIKKIKSIKKEDDIFPFI